MSDMSILIQSFSHKYHRKWAVRDVSFEFGSKGVYGVLGCNGAGKSTILNALSGVLKPTQGSVRIAGVDIRQSARNARAMLGFLPQQPPLHSEFTIAEFLSYAASLRGVGPKERDRAVHSVAERFELVDHLDRLIGTLSGGYRQRVGLAQAVVHSPKVVILDEPTNGLDPIQILGVRKLIRSIAEQSTVVMSTHILAEVQALCSTVFVIHEGEQVYLGDADDFRRQGETPYVIAKFRTETPNIGLDALRDKSTVVQIDSRSVRVETDDTIQTRRSIIEHSVRYGWDLIEIKEAQASFEDAFTALIEPGAVA